MSAAKRKAEFDGKAFAVDARKRVRTAIAEGLHDWRECWIDSEPGGLITVRNRDGVIVEFDWNTLRRKAPGEYMDILRALLAELTRQSVMAGNAVQIAKVELEIDVKRRRGADNQRRAEDARKREARLSEEAAAMRAKRNLSNAALAKTLANRGLGGAEAIRKKLPGKKKKPGDT